MRTLQLIIASTLATVGGAHTAMAAQTPVGGEETEPPPWPAQPGPAQPGPVQPPLPPSVPSPERTTKPAPYSLPWHLRPVFAVTAIRPDTVVAVRDGGSTIVSLLTVSTRIHPEISLAVRYGWVHDIPKHAYATSAFTNMAVSGTYAPATTGPVHFAATAALVVPTAQGGGSAPNPLERRAIGAGALARSAMDNVMFAADDLGLVGGAGVAYVAHGFTIQIEATVAQLLRVKGAAVQKEAAKTNTTWGAHVGYFIVPQLSIGAEVRYQFLIVPIPAERDRRDTATVALGIRGHLLLGGQAFRPGIAYAHPLDNPMAAAGYRVAQIDLPFDLPFIF